MASLNRNRLQPNATHYEDADSVSLSENEGRGHRAPWQAEPNERPPRAIARLSGVALSRRQPPLAQSDRLEVNSNASDVNSNEGSIYDVNSNEGGIYDASSDEGSIYYDFNPNEGNPRRSRLNSNTAADEDTTSASRLTPADAIAPKKGTRRLRLVAPWLTLFLGALSCAAASLALLEVLTSPPNDQLLLRIATFQERLVCKLAEMHPPLIVAQPTLTSTLSKHRVNHAQYSLPDELHNLSATLAALQANNTRLKQLLSNVARDKGELTAGLANITAQLGLPAVMDHLDLLASLRARMSVVELATAGANGSSFVVSSTPDANLIQPTPDLRARVGAGDNMTLSTLYYAMPPPSAKFTSLITSPDGQLALGGSYSGELVAFLTSNGSSLWSRAMSTPVNSISISPDGYTGIAGLQNGSVSIFSAQTGAINLTFLADREGLVTFVLYSPDNRHFFTSGSNKYIVMWNTTGAAINIFKEHARGAARSMDISADGRYLLAIDGSHADVWDLTRFKLACGLVKGFLAGAMSRDHSFVYLTTEFGTLEIYGPAQANMVYPKFAVLSTSCGGAPTSLQNNASVVLTPGEDRVVIGTWCGVVRSFDTAKRSSTYLRELNLGDVVLAMAMTSAGELITSDNQGLTRFWRPLEEQW
jgi:WD40 repeat protein